MDVESFIVAVRRHTMKEEKYNDTPWISNFVASCFEGAALRWHVALPPNIQNDWCELQKALLASWNSPHNGGEHPR